MSSTTIGEFRRGRDRSQSQSMRRVARRQRYLSNALAAVLSVVVLIWTILPLYNIVMVSLEDHNDVFSDKSVPLGSVARWLLGGLHPGLLVPGGFLAPVRQQHLCRRRDHVPDPGDRLGGQLLDLADARPARLDAVERGTDDLCDPAIVPGDPVLSDHAELRLDQQPVVGHRGHGHLRHAVCDVHLPAIRPQHPDRARRVGADRRRLPDADLLPHLSAVDGAGTGRGRHLCAAARLERVPVPVPHAVGQAEHDRAGGTGRVPQQRRGAVELHDGDGDRLRGTADRNLLSWSAAG